MPTQIKNVDLTGAVVGTRGTISWEGIQQPPTLAQQMRPLAESGPTVALFNESPCQLRIDLPETSQSFSLPAGRWAPIPVPPLENSLNYTVTAIGGAGIYNNLLADYFTPGEAVYPIGVLGNSPIGGSVSVSALTTLLQYLVSPGVLTGISATKDGVFANQLDVSSGVIFVSQTGGGIGAFAPAATAFLVSAPFTNYFLDFNSNGTYSFGTSHSTDPLALALYQVSTDGAGNINAATIVAASGFGIIDLLPRANTAIRVGESGAAFDTVLGLNAFGGVTQVANTKAQGSFGVPVIVASIFQSHVTTVGQKTLLSYTPTFSGVFRISSWVTINNAVNNNVVLYKVSYTDNISGLTRAAAMTATFNSSTAPTVFNTAVQGNDFFACFPVVINVKGGTTINLLYNDTTNTPNDFIDMVIEQLI